MNTSGFDINTRGVPWNTKGVYINTRGVFMNKGKPFAIDAPPRNDERPFAMDAPPRKAENRPFAMDAPPGQCANTPSLRWLHGEEFKPTLALPKSNDYGCIHRVWKIRLSAAMYMAS